ncbi:MAG: flagellin [Fibrobacter sp.]|nr:flagellin [Fibrobacter sp.]
MRINKNISSMITNNTLFKTNRNLGKSIEKLSTGLRIKQSSDDAAGLSISENLRTQIRGTAQARKNAMDGTALLQIAEGAANEISAIIQRMRELALQASSDTFTSNERIYANDEFSELRDDIDRIAASTNYNKVKMISGTEKRFGVPNAVNNNTLWIDAGHQTGTDSITITIDTLTVESLSPELVTTTLTNQNDAVKSISYLDSAINSVNSTRANIGTYVNRLEHAINYLMLSELNQQNAESIIRDVDFAREHSNFIKNQILTESGTAMLAQAHLIPEGLLSLFETD